MIERLEKFSLANTLLQTSKYDDNQTQRDVIPRLATGLSDIPAGCWFHSPGSQYLAWEKFTHIISFVISGNKEYHLWPQEKETRWNNLLRKPHRSDQLCGYIGGHHNQGRLPRVIEWNPGSLSQAVSNDLDRRRPFGSAGGPFWAWREYCILLANRVAEHFAKDGEQKRNRFLSRIFQDHKVENCWFGYLESYHNHLMECRTFFPPLSIHPYFGEGRFAVGNTEKACKGWESEFFWRVKRPKSLNYIHSFCLHVWLVLELKWVTGD